MLKRLVVKNFAIIDYISLDFHQGMTVLTGETGAGKSIIVDAISLLLGERAAKEMISSKSDFAEIIGEFDIQSKEIKNLLDEAGIDSEESLVINRIIAKDNRNMVKINNQNASLKTLKELSVYLADIHSQFDTNQLIYPDNYLNLIDNFRRTRVKPLMDSYQASLEEYKTKIKDYQVTLNKKKEAINQLDLYKFQLQELTNLDLIVDEYQEAIEKVNIMENIDKINTLLEKAKVNLNDEMLLDKLYEIKDDFHSISRFSSEFESIHERLNNIYYELDDINSLIINRSQNLDFEKNDFESLVERINDLEKVQKKYNKTIEELIAYQKFLEVEIDTFENFDQVIKQKEELVKIAFENVLQAASNLSTFRKDIAGRITKDIVETLQELVIKHAQFNIDFKLIVPENAFDVNAFRTSGLDICDFLISTNKGEPVKPLAKTASGGEMSRVMLAFKTIFARSQKTPTVIFDEIDTGISGYIAKQIARKINELAQITQVISITHIPQVVAQGTYHLAVTKKIVNNLTLIKVKYLNHEERILEIAKMVSADKVTKAAKDIARELLLNP
ncbi:MAG: DNA repair protein RecN [Candidatus Izemoplasmatales bacterium]|nr:DNA repair protein RecN [Candidatus Izemoplasmatales bacterium]